METQDIIVIGAGAAGLMAAIGAAGEGASVLVLEKMPRPGRKIMITGKGRCNFTNLKAWNEFSTHIHPKPNFLKPSFYNLDSARMMGFLEANGMESIVERGDRVFPASHLASDVVDALVRAANASGAKIICNKEVSEITSSTPSVTSSTPSVMSSTPSVRSSESETPFTLKCTDGTTYTCRRLIICTGGLSYPKTGSTGDGYRWAAEYGHSVRTLFPSLTAIVPSGYKIMDQSVTPPNYGKAHISREVPLSESGRLLCGNQLKNISLTVVIDGNQAASEFGDMDFTDGGIEGPVGFKVSRKCVNALINGSKVTAVLDLKPAVEIEDLTVRINTLWNEISKDKRNANRPYKDRYRILLTKVLPMSLIQGFVKLNPNADHKTLAKSLKNWKFEIAGYVGYERCVITAGGVSCEEVAPKTLESKLNPGLYFAGEVLDLDADTGGYNLQTAFSTGYLSGISAAKSILKAK